MSGSVILRVLLLKSSKQQQDLGVFRDILIQSFENGTVTRLVPVFPPAFGQTDRAQQWTDWIQAADPWKNLTNLTSVVSNVTLNETTSARPLTSARIDEVRIVPQPFL